VSPSPHLIQMDCFSPRRVLSYFLRKTSLNKLFYPSVLVFGSRPPPPPVEIVFRINRIYLQYYYSWSNLPYPRPLHSTFAQHVPSPVL
jgi:hypothetical protein